MIDPSAPPITPKPPKPPKPTTTPVNNRTLSAADALARAGQLSHGDYQYDGWCSSFVQDAVLGDKHGALGHADVWYNRAKSQGAVNTTVAPPAGTAVFYDSSNVHDHVALSAGNGYVWSTGINGRIQRVPMDNLYGGGAGSTPNRGWTSRFGNQYVDYKNAKTGQATSGTSRIVSSGTSATDSSSVKGSSSTPTSTPSPSAVASPTPPPTANLVSLAPITGPRAFTTGSRNLSPSSSSRISAPSNPLINSEG